jgi:hypothetical protein
MLFGSASIAGAALEVPPETQASPIRLGFLEGDVLFWRPGAGDWEAAQLNIPLAAGDALATRAGKLELQIGARSFLRAGDNTQLRLKSNEPDFLQMDISAGSLVADVRDLSQGAAVEIDTPNAVVSIAHDGYYRIDLDGETTHFVVRRGGHASLKPAGGSSADVATGEAVDIDGKTIGRLTSLAAPPFDGWDRWNYDRVDSFLAAPRSNAVSPEIYGTEELQQNGDWQYDNQYGNVWVPSSVPVGWAPYSSGRWLWDPLYGWSWVDSASWGWAPFHYGRWVYPGYWAWAPGPVVGVPFYSPALVAFFGGPGFSVGIGFPFVSWVALGWGEPLVPWWGPVGFIGSPCWWGWGGPRVVNNIVINNNTIVNANTINLHRNANVPGAMVGVPKDQFGNGAVNNLQRVAQTQGFKPLNGALPVSGKGAAGLASAPPKMQVPNLNAQRATANLQRNGAAGATNLARQSPQSFGGTPRNAVPPLSSGSKLGPAGAAALAAVQQRGPGALTGPSHAPAAGSPTNFTRGQVPPPIPNPGARSSAAGSAFDALRAGGSSATRSLSGAAPPMSRPTDFNRATSPQFNRSVAAPDMQRGSLASRSVPPPVPRRMAYASSAIERSNGWGRSSMPSTYPMRTARAPAPAPAPNVPNYGRGFGGSAPSVAAHTSAPAPAHPSVGHSFSMGGFHGGGFGGRGGR